ncbi:SubName: Full=Uncharacterized protein {ECO:0000313/EMBL:CCA75461.1} [Serendipita indica DSM 11827]|nr:SubName: Full=Uncharacterized protein {ECO:0000313/EMBL:CCA75461.1} [Serendipita indica DSM 11827]
MNWCKTRDPRIVLPMEIFTSILNQVITEGFINPIRLLLPLTLVSQGWLDYIVNTPELWVHIDVGRGLEEADSLAKLATSLALSKDQRLYLVIVYEINNWDMIFSLLRPHITRIRSLSFLRQRTETIQRRDWEYSQRQIIRCLKDFGYLPDLLSITADGDWAGGIWIERLSYFPTLRQILIRKIHPRAIENLQCPEKVQDFTTLLSIGVCYPLLGILSGLRKLRMGSMPPEEPPNEDGILPTALYTLAVREILTDSAARLVFKVIRMAPRLRRIGLLIEWNRLTELMSILPSLLQLETLQLELTKPTASRSESLHLLAPETPTGVKDLYIRYQDSTDALYYHQALAKYLRHAMPFLLDLRLDCYILPTPYMSYIKSLKHLLRLRIAAGRAVVDKDSIIQSDSLETLNIHWTTADQGYILEKLHCPGLLRLSLCEAMAGTIRDPPSFAHYQVLSTTQETIQLPDMKALRTLELSGRSILYMPLDSLTRIVFDKYTSTASEFFIKLINQPDMCAMLQRIELYCFPEWDLLFLLLERRGFASFTRPIEEIMLPANIPIYLLRPLVNLLGDQTALRPPNEDVSLDAIADITTDYTIPGCMWCSWSFQTCATPIPRLTHLRSTPSIAFNHSKDPKPKTRTVAQSDEEPRRKGQ